MSENQQALNHVVSMEDLTVDQVMSLKMEPSFPMKTIRLFPISSLRILHGHISPLKSQRLNLDWNDLTLM
ncbi:aspartate carbamoyltransferase [Streptococcus pneumoniae]|nr:aspartate carbamoyltransferase [Streptococcus pneumoniae]